MPNADFIGKICKMERIKSLQTWIEMLNLEINIHRQHVAVLHGSEFCRFFVDRSKLEIHLGKILCEREKMVAKLVDLQQ